MKTIRLTIENTRKTAMLVFVEPEAMDFWLLPGEQCQLVAPVVAEEQSYFEIQHTDNGVTVFPSRGSGRIEVFLNQRKLEYGHQRPATWP